MGTNCVLCDIDQPRQRLPVLVPKCKCHMDLGSKVVSRALRKCQHGGVAWPGSGAQAHREDISEHGSTSPLLAHQRVPARQQQAEDRCSAPP